MTSRLMQRAQSWLALLLAAGFLVAQSGAGEHGRGSAEADGPDGAAARQREPARPLRFDPRAPLAIGLLALLAMTPLLIAAPQAAAAGWLIAFVFWSSISIGSVVAMAIHVLTGGRWGERGNAAFMPTAAAVPLMAVLLAPILAALPELYPWAVDSGRVDPEVSSYYLNPTFLIGRSVIAFCGWTALAYALPRLSGRTAVLVAAIGLAFHGLVVGPIGVDWILSIEPVFMSTSFGATFAFVQLAAAIAWALIALPDRRPSTGLGDLGGLLLATLLGITYINFMAVLIIWYGDLPSQVFWFVHRDRWPWTLIGGLTFVLGSVVPVFALFVGRARTSPVALRIIGVIALAGIALYWAYLIAPPFGSLSLACAAVALIAMGALLTAFLALPWSRAGYERWSSADEH